MPRIDLTRLQRDVLARVAEHMIPASAEHDLPGAHDPAIQAAILQDLSRDAAGLRPVLDGIAGLADGAFMTLPLADQAGLLDRWRAANPAPTQLLEQLISRAYYQDARLRRWIDVAHRPPYPKGYDLADDDWSLLDPVRQMGQVWRPAR